MLFRSEPYNNNYYIVQTKDYVTIMAELNHEVRIIPIDGRPHLPAGVTQWVGDSRGKWEGDTLVVETTGFNGKLWLDQIGHPTTDKLRVTERFTRTHYGHLRIDVTIDDPGAYSRPFTATYTATLEPDSEIMEYICIENNQYGLAQGKNLPLTGGNSTIK